MLGNVVITRLGRISWGATAQMEQWGDIGTNKT